jgi:ACS family glucarate transporter-like MFS transporter
MADVVKPGEHGGGPTWVRWRIVGVLLAYSFMSWFNRVSMAVAYDEQIQNEYPITEQQIGWVYSAFLFAYMICMTPGGWLADRVGPYGALVLMGFGSALFGVLTGLVGLSGLTAVSLLVWLLVVRTLMGAFTAPIYPASGRTIAHWIPSPQRAGVNGLVMAAALVGIASTYQVFGMLLDGVGWPGAFLITGGVTAALALLWTWYGRNYPSQHGGVNAAEQEWIQKGAGVVARPEDKGTDHEREKVGASQATAGRLPDGGVRATRPTPLWRNRSLILLTLSYAAVGYFEYLFYFWMHYYFEDVLHLGKERSRLYATVVNLAMAAGMGLGGLLSDRLRRRFGHRWGHALVPMGGMLAGAGFLGLGLLAQEPGWIVTWFALALASVGATEGPFWALAIELGGRHSATSAGIFNTGGNAGGVLAPILTPFVSRQLGWPWGIGLGSLVCLVGVVLWLGIDPDKELR